jgi:hypothetical protein
MRKDIELDASPLDGEYPLFREIDLPLAESKISKNLYSDYIVKLKRLPLKDR